MGYSITYSSIKPLEDLNDTDFFICDVKIKKQDKMIDYFKSKIDIPVEVRKLNGLAIFSTSKQSLLKAIDFCYDNYEEIVRKFEINNSTLDLSPIHKQMLE